MAIDREKVLRLRAAGLTFAEIATRLGCDERSARRIVAGTDPQPPLAVTLKAWGAGDDKGVLVVADDYSAAHAAVEAALRARGIEVQS